LNDYEKVSNFESLYRANKSARRGKQTQAEVIVFEMNLGYHLWKLKTDLDSKRYKTKPYYTFMIYDPKKRKIDALHYADRVIQHSLCDNVLAPFFERRLIYDNAACRIGKGTHFAMDRLTLFLREHYKKHKTTGYILKCDIRKFFDNIDHEVLKEKLAKVIPDQEVLRLLNQIVDSYNKDTGKGLPLGNQTSQWFSLYYLDEMDRLIKEKLRIKHYTRYMDDFILVHESKDYLKHCLQEIKALLTDKLKLELNEKTQILPIKNGAEYLGWRFYLTNTGKVIKRLRTSNKRRFKRRLKQFVKEYKCGKMELEEIKRSLSSYNGHLQHGHTYKLKQKLYGDFMLTRESKATTL
jgi:RNA-directed DNA polymerase